MYFKEKIEQYLQPHLQKDLSISIDDRVFKTGKFILYNFHDFHLEIALNQNNKIKKALLPLPFSIHLNSQNNTIYFDYRIQTIHKKFKLRNCASRYYNTILGITFL